MSAALRFTRIKVQNVGTLGEREVELASMSPGINVISGPNECGKSSIVRALRASLFQRYGSGHASIKALRPYGTMLAPHVEVDFEVDGVAYQLEKRFLKKGMSRVRALDGSLVLENDEADSWLFDRLGAREPAKKGVNFDDMGVWGLLWVQQDAYATDQPAQMMGEHVRGSLSRTIGALVGNVMGGEHGVALKRAIEDEHDRFWTAKTQEATDRLAAVRKRVSELEDAVSHLKRREDETTTLGDQLQERERERDALDAEIAERRAALEVCEREAAEGDALERRRDEAADALRDAEETRRLAVERDAARVASRSRLEQDETSLRTRVALAERLRNGHLQREAALRSAREVSAETRRDVERLLASVERQRARLEDLRGREELRRLDEVLGEARRLDAAVREAREALRGLPDRDALAAMTDLEARRAQHAEHTARHATRVVVREGEGESSVSVSTRQTVPLGALGSITLDPPREGFLAARRAWSASRDRLVATLEALRVPSVSAARELAAEHERVRAEVEGRHARLNELAPKGFGALSQECDRAEAHAAGLARRRDEAASLRDARDATELELAGNRLGADALQALVEMEAEVRSRAALEANAAVWVTVRPLAAARVQIGARDTPRLMTPGAELRRPVTGPLTLVVDDKVQVEIDPGASATAVGLEDAQRRLAEALAEHGLESFDHARRLGAARASLQAKRDHLDDALRERAPHGVDALGEQHAKAARAHESLRRKRDDAQALQLEIANLEAQRPAAAMRPEDFRALDELDRRCFSEEQLLRRLSGRVVSAEGPVAAEVQGREDLVDPVVLGVGSARVEIVPGEVPHDVDLPMIERELRARLKGFGLDSLDAAHRAHRAWIERDADLHADLRALERLAPQGLTALDGEAARARAKVGAEPAELASREAVEAELEVARQRLDARRLEQISADARAEGASAEEESARAAYEKAEHERVELTARRDAHAEQLRAEASIAADGAIRDAAEAAWAAERRWQESFEAAARACDAALPEVRRADRDRARSSLDDVARRLQATRERYARDKGVLDGKLGEGYHDQLATAEASLLAAQAERARVEREARAVKLLRDTAAAAYGESQRALMEPVSKEAMPLLQLIRPGTSFRMNQDTMQLEQVMREGLEEDFKDLSGGAREQLAVVVRIALAKVFARENRALPLILDDILGWTDDRRLRAMLNVIERTSKDLQVILLTCHPARFRGMSGARSYDLDELKREV